MAKITNEYCSKYESYNGKKVTDGKVLAPVMISDAEFKSNNSIIRENLRTWKHCGVPFRVGFEVVDANQFDHYLSVYYSCVNDVIDTDYPELRPGRCLLGIDKEGMPVICNKHGHSCKGCPHRNENLPRYKNAEDYFQKVSFQDVRYDDEGNEVTLDVADPNADPEEEAIQSVLLIQLFEFLEKQEPRLATMAKLGYEGSDKETIFKAVGLGASQGYKGWKRAKALVMEFLGL